jgi:transcriptional regulator with XRE-family HTH domain
MLIKSKEDLAKQLADTRRAQGMSITALAKKADADPAVISRMEHGKSNITMVTLIRIVKALGKRLHISIK